MEEPLAGEHVGQVRRRVQGRVPGLLLLEQGHERHNHEAGVSSVGGRLGDRRLPVPITSGTVSVPNTPSAMKTYTTVVTPSAT